jgi:hypothetical protein
MRKLGLIALISLCCLYVAAQDQGSEPVIYKNSFKVSPLGFFNSTFLMSYERLIGNDKALDFTAGITYKSSDDESVNGYRGEFRFHYFIMQRVTSKASRKVYFAPFLFDQYTKVTEPNYYYNYPYPTEEDTYTYDVNSVGFGVVMGVNWIFARRFVLDAFIGGGLKTSNMDDSSSSYLDDGLNGYGYKGIFPRVGLDLGFTF